MKYIDKVHAMNDIRHSMYIQEHKTEIMFMLALVTAVLIPLCLSAFRAFATNYATTIYRDFSAYAPPPTAEDIRVRANWIYEQEVRPNGNADKHWKQAEEQLRG